MPRTPPWRVPPLDVRPICWNGDFLAELSDIFKIVFDSGAGKGEDASEQVPGGRLSIEDRGRGGGGIRGGMVGVEAPGGSPQGGGSVEYSYSGPKLEEDQKGYPQKGYP